MNKKYKITTLLVMGMCFFVTMLFADVFFTNKTPMKNNGNKVMAADLEKEMFLEKQELFTQALILENKDANNNLSTSESEANSDEAAKTNVLDNKVDDNFVNESDNKVIDTESEDVLVSDRALDIAAEDINAVHEEDLEEISVLSMESARIANVVTFDKVLPKVSEFLNIRTEASADAAVVGKLYKDSYAKIVERGDEWTKITSGGVTGYASSEYLYFDQDAIDVATKLTAFKVKITAGKVNIRESAGTDSEVLKEAKMDETFIHIQDSDKQGWVAIQYGETGVAYVSSEFAEDFIDLDTAVSKAKEEEIQKAKEVAKALEEAKKFQPVSTNRSAIKTSDEDIFLIATVVAMEAIGESYEGKLAVANVIVNRYLSGRWGNTFKDVIYAPNQFSGANSGRIEKFEPKVTESCKKAAVEALAGNNNIGNYMSFIMKSSAKYSSYSKYYVLGCHVFYAR